MTFDPTITLGVVVHLLGLLIGLVGAWLLFVRKLDARFAELDRCFHTLHDENKHRLQVLGARLDVMEARVGDLWRWFIGRTPGGGGGA